MYIYMSESKPGSNKKVLAMTKEFLEEERKRKTTERERAQYRDKWERVWERAERELREKNEQVKQLVDDQEENNRKRKREKDEHDKRLQSVIDDFNRPTPPEEPGDLDTLNLRF